METSFRVLWGKDFEFLTAKFMPSVIGEQKKCTKCKKSKRRSATDLWRKGRRFQTGGGLSLSFSGKKGVDPILFPLLGKDKLDMKVYLLFFCLLEIIGTYRHLVGRMDKWTIVGSKSCCPQWSICLSFQGVCANVWTQGGD